MLKKAWGRWGAAGLGFSVLCALAQERAWAVKSAPVALVLTADPDTRLPATAFGCVDRLYMYSRFDPAVKGPQTMVTEWIGPDGFLRERTETTVDLNRRPGAEVYSWLQFNREKRGLFQEFRLGGDYGVSDNPLAGEWRVRLLLNGAPVKEQPFSVACFE